MILDQRNRGRGCRLWTQSRSWRMGEDFSAEAQVGNDGKAWRANWQGQSSACQEAKLAGSENTSEEQSEEIKKKPQNGIGTAVFLWSTSQTQSSQGQERAPCEPVQMEPLGQDVARAIPGPRVRCTLGMQRGGVRAPSPLKTLCIHFPGLQEQRTANRVPYNNRRVLSHSLEARSPKSRHQQGHAPSETCSGGSRLASF